MPVCPDCGAPISADSPAGLCIPCVLRMAQDAPAPQLASLRPDQANAHASQVIGNFELLRELGRGGMGVVYEAVQRKLNRKVALKVILAGEFASEAAVTRFKEEAEAIGGLDHPNIVPIYEVGEFEGRHYYSMKLILGESLARQLERSASSKAPGARSTEPMQASESPAAAYLPRAAGKLMAKVARAVHFVHQRGIIHRDLSPENILLDEQGEPWVADFGLARLFDQGRITRTYTLVGKPDYMSPEQADPGGPDITTASDIFSLGAILYEVLTGQPPFSAKTPLATLDRVRHENPRPPSALVSGIDRDLDTICLKCLAKGPERRYSSASALADDLDRWMTRQPILAHPARVADVFWKWILRNRWKTAAVCFGLLAVSIPFVVAAYFYDSVLPAAARAHPTVGRDQNIAGFMLPFDTGRVDRATMNFDMFVFQKRPRQSSLYFTNVPSEVLPWVSALKCQVIADIPAAPDEPRSPIVKQGDHFIIDKPQRRDRAYYIAPFGWKGDDVLARAPNARLVVVVLDGD